MSSFEDQNSSMKNCKLKEISGCSVFVCGAFAVAVDAGETRVQLIQQSESKSTE